MKFSRILCFAAALLTAAMLRAELKLDSVFSDNMVLQQQKPIRIFGTAKPGSRIKVVFDGKSAETTAADSSRWSVEFPAMTASETPRTLTVSDGEKELALRNILIGEVWFCSGQSNMLMPVGARYRRGWSELNCEKVCAEANFPLIRLAPQKLALNLNRPLPAAFIGGKGWLVCSPATVADFSAAAYFFARELHLALKVPVGVIQAAWGGKPIQPFISLEGYQAAGLENYARRIIRARMPEDKLEKFVRDTTEKFERDRREYTARFRAAGAAAKEKSAGWSAPGADDAGWVKFSADRPKGSAVRWCRVRFTIPEAMRGKPLLFMMNKCADAAEVYLNGEKIAAWDPWDPAKKQQLGRNLRPQMLPADGRCVLTVRGEYLDVLEMPRLQKVIESTARLGLGKERFYIKKGWLQRDEFVAAGLGRAPRLVLPSKEPIFPGNIFNGMIAAWTAFPVRGILWYQGCANAGNPEYYVLQKALIADWRKQWGDAELPFIITQLAGFDMRRKETWRTADPNQPFAFAVTRDIQHQVSRELKNVGLVTAVDLGDVDNIHPGTKRELGHRYLLEALRIAYGRKIVSQGPVFVSATPEGSLIRVRFANAEGGLVTADGKAPGAFAVAGSDGKFVWADRTAIDGESVTVGAAAVPEPKFVRYAYAGFRGDCNLRNKEGLPALPFRSDAVDYSKPIRK